MRASIVQTAIALAEVCLAAGDVSEAAWAVAQGQLGVPGDERL